MSRKYFIMFEIILLIGLVLIYGFTKNYQGINRKEEGEIILERKNEIGLETDKLEMSAWLPWWEERRGVESMIESGGKLKMILPVWYQINDQATLVETKSTQRQEIIDLSKEMGILIIPTISNADNASFDANRISKILRNDELIDNFIEETKKLAVENGFAGWDLDWEEILETDRDLYSEFVKRVAESYKEARLKLSITVHAQSGEKNEWVGVKGQDLYSLGKYSDFIRVMAYDFHYIGSTPGPITPIDKLIKVIEHNLELIPVEKLVLALPTYGYDWGENETIPLQYYKIEEISETFGTKPILSQDPYSYQLQYKRNGATHTIWYENNQTLAKKIEKIREYGIYQICLWHLGGEDAEIWTNEDIWID